MSADPARERLKAYFADVPDGGIGRRWADMWKEGDWLPFDRHTPNPALNEALEKHLDLSATPSPPSLAHALGSPVEDDADKAGKVGGLHGRKTALVPGCGRGYDAILLAAYGYHAVGLEISDTAVRKAKELYESIELGLKGDPASGLNDEQLAPYRTRDEKVGRGSVQFVAGDFFEDGFLQESGVGKAFDLTYDYTFLSALPPSMRPAWSRRMRDLTLKQNGRLICVEFPTYKAPETGGPPWGLPPIVYLAHLGRPGSRINYGQEGNVILDDEHEKAMEQGKAIDHHGMIRVAHWKAEKTHEIGKGTDHVSIWKRAEGS